MTSGSHQAFNESSAPKSIGLRLLIRWLWHLIFVTGVLGGAVTLGAIAGLWLHENVLSVGERIRILDSHFLIEGINLRDAAVAVIPVTVALTAWKDFAKLVLSVWETVTNVNSVPKILPDAFGVAALAAYFAVAAETLSDRTSADPVLSPESVVHNAIALLRTEPQAKARLRYLFPLAETVSGRQPEKLELISFKSGHNFTKDSPAIGDIKTVVTALGACAQRGGAPPVRINVIGYSDQNEFLNWTEEGSREANRRLANERARSLSSVVQSVVSSERLNIQVTTVEWERIDDMQADPAYLRARPLSLLRAETGRQDNFIDQGLFNRRADIELIDLSDCEPLEEDAPV